MARRPYFSGNYGSALGSYDTAAKLIAQSGQAQGQMFANLGQQIGGAIEKYQLNKEKQKENKATIKSSIGILQRMSKIDEANAPEYMASIQQLENEDIPLSQRGMLADKTLQGLSITNQLQGQMLSNQGKQQALGLAKQLEASTVENAKLQNTNLGFRNDLAELTKRKGEAITSAEIRSILSKYDAEQEIRPSQTEATISANRASGLQNDTASAYILGQGGPAGMAKQRMQDDDLKRRGAEADIRSKDSLSNYRNKSIELLEGRSNLPQGSGNEEIETSIKGIDTEIDRIMKGQTFSKDSDGNTLSYSDLIEEINPITGEVTLSEDASNYASKDIARLKELIQSKMQLRLSQKYKVVNRNGEIIEVSLADIEEQKAKEMMRSAEIQNAVKSSPPAFPMPDYH